MFFKFKLPQLNRKKCLQISSSIYSLSNSGNVANQNKILRQVIANSNAKAKVVCVGNKVDLSAVR